MPGSHVCQVAVSMLAKHNCTHVARTTRRPKFQVAGGGVEKHQLGVCSQSPHGRAPLSNMPAGNCLGALATDAACQLDVLGHDGHALGVDGAQVGVLKQAHQVRLGSLLQRQHGGALEAQVGLEVLGNLTHQALEGQLADEQLRGLLVLADLTQGHCAGPVAMGLLHTAGGGRGLARGLGGQLLAGRLATGGLAGGLLGASPVSL